MCCLLQDVTEEQTGNFISCSVHALIHLTGSKIGNGMLNPLVCAFLHGSKHYK
jgi:hypothetical protein